MAPYFAMRIMQGKLNYQVVISKYPQCQENIDLILAAEEYTVNENGAVIKLD